MRRHTIVRAAALGSLVLGLALTGSSTVWAQDNGANEDASRSGSSTGDKVECAESTGEVTTEVPWAQQMLGAPREWELSAGRGVSVAVVDSGVDATVESLAGRVRPGVSLIPADSIPGGTSATRDCSGHGTFLASIVGAARTAGRGFAGLAPSATIVPVQFEAPQQRAETLDFAAGLRAAVDEGAAVVLVGKPMPYPTGELAEAIDYAAKQDVLVVTPPLVVPALGSAEPLATVVAAGSVGSDGAAAAAKTDSPGLIDLVAPGKDVTALGVGGGELTASAPEIAAAFVAGTAVLVRSHYPTMSAAQVKQRIVATATLPGAAVPDRLLGAGLVNPAAAVDKIMETRRAAEAPAVQPVDLSRPPGPDQSARDRALILAGGAVLLLTVTALLGVTVRAGRRRGWRSARGSEQR